MSPPSCQTVCAVRRAGWQVPPRPRARRTVGRDRVLGVSALVLLAAGTRGRARRAPAHASWRTAGLAVPKHAASISAGPPSTIIRDLDALVHASRPIPPVACAHVSTAPIRVYVARLVGLPIFDPQGDQVGKVRDLVAAVRSEVSQPRVLGMVAEVFGRRRIFVPMTRVTNIDSGQVYTTGLLNMRRFEQRPTETLVIGPDAGPHRQDHRDRRRRHRLRRRHGAGPQPRLGALPGRRAGAREGPSAGAGRPTSSSGATSRA